VQNTMSPSTTSAANTISRARPAQRRHPVARLSAMMACDTAFRVLARRYLADLTANHEATCSGDAAALHQMRIALTRLRTAILFFAPMIDDPMRMQIKSELKWLNGQLGAVRDLDVAMERLKAINKQRPRPAPYYRTWNEKRADSHRQLARALQSARYRRLIENTSGWIESGPWSIKTGRQAALERASPIATFGVGKLMTWQDKLLKRSRKLEKMGNKKRHRLRLLNKKLTYSIEFFEDLLADKRFSKQQTALKHLRKAQRSLGQLNDDVQGHSLAAALQQGGVRPPLQFLSPKRERRLIRTATTAYRKLAATKAFRS
jgi:CHAD domain-containing protein